MTSRIRELSDKIAKLEQRLIEELKSQEDEFRYKLRGKKVEFEEAVLEAHKELKVSIPSWLRSAAVRNTLSAPFIYAMIIPIAFMDLTVTLYQQICFRLYNISMVRRSDYIVMDRHQLGYLNGVEKFNCLYCGYGNGVIAYTREIIARTEQYWCPIKHSRKIVGTHRRYNNFLGFGEAEDYHTKLLKFRDDMREEK